ncbi:GNAT family N-acetyltransferase [Streptococcus merionis]|uniref:GNAT family N-acetyltransferase n=1 Tax=Streptococcus merionis TaxID=400065 RepID=UPI0026ED7B3E|nr:GNAT family N-acetyltransferase [Streptococcus merionis]
MRLNETEKVAYLFADWPETMIWSCLQGIMGEILVDDLEVPKSALAKIGKLSSFGFLAGEPCLDLIEACRGEDIILVPQHIGWFDLIETTFGEKAHAFTRYATKKNTVFDRRKLASHVTALSEEYEFHLIDETFYQKCLSKAWSQDLVGNFDDFQHFQDIGLGVVVTKEKQVLAGASSYSAYQGGIEIEIDTHPDFRRQGLAKAVAAKLILECLNRNLYPSWDAHTKASLALAQQLGYELSHEYIAYEIDW